MTQDAITSVRNPLIQSLRALKDNQARAQSGLFLIEGPVMLNEALKCGLKPETFLCERGRDEFNELIDLMRGLGARTEYASRAVLEAVCDTRAPQGVCASFHMPKEMDTKKAPDLLVALDGVQDPGNVGTIWRTADAAGFGGLLLGANCADPFSPKVQRAAMGSGFRLPILRVAALNETLTALRKEGYSVIATSLGGTPFYDRPPLKKKIVLVIGSEAHGVSESALAASDIKLRLPMRGGAESLNAAVAAGIMMYELTKDLFPADRP